MTYVFIGKTKQPWPAAYNENQSFSLRMQQYKVSYREVLYHDHYHGLDLDPRQMVDDALSLEERLGTISLPELCFSCRVELAEPPTT